MNNLESLIIGLYLGFLLGFFGGLLFWYLIKKKRIDKLTYRIIEDLREINSMVLGVGKKVISEYVVDYIRKYEKLRGYKD